ncbi:filamentous hemagglutinin N-terminal domain-containing protein [Mixta intestinalis]|uniref:tRNA nuclease CdiA-2 n=1 Tax=Mixta intestinalis TaxID=1615494 RepID=A0A6P1Q3D8_9GAMM|nr:filamentous hemagglutinin N-terminal domain-containing protein [Mixta intestinalis]QHM72365.1 tRNA nuclease CdiA-2 [Mixta intestinalis]
MVFDNFKFNPLCLSIMLLTGSVASVQAAVVADSSVRQKINVVTNSNGSEMVHINAPSASGVSHNKYSRFDVNEKGLVLNNSKQSSLTSVAGQVAGNRNLEESGSARVILNEVTSNRASSLKGNLEVAGQSAHVIIANPNGITCNGCDFINTTRNTLTTGKPIMQYDDLKGFSVQGGTITITGQGMKDNYSGYTDLIARAIKINGPLEANNLTVMAANNDHISIEDNVVVAKGKADTSNSGVGIDVTNLGGMYANKITMVANYNGIGVRNAGVIQSLGDLTIDSMGHITNNKTMSAENLLKLKAAGDFTNSTNSSVQGLLLNTEAKNITNAGSITAGHATIKAKGKLSNQGGIVALGNMLINAVELENKDGLIHGVNSLTIDANRVSNTQSEAINHAITSVTKGLASNGNLTITADKLVNNGTIYADGNIQLEADEIDAKHSNTLSGGNITIKTPGVLSTADAFISSVNGNVNIDAGSVSNAEKKSYLWGLFNFTNYVNGAIFANGDINYKVKDTTDNYNYLKANNNVTVDAQSNFNNNNFIEGKKVTLKGSSINNASRINAENAIDIDAKTSFNNSGVLNSSGSILLNGPSVVNTGKITAAQTTIYAPSYKNTGDVEGSFSVVGHLKPEQETPEVDQPEVDQPEVDQPEVDQPEVDQPEVNQPEVDQPEVDQPEVDQPEVDQPSVDIEVGGDSDESDDKAARTIIIGA